MTQHFANIVHPAIFGPNLPDDAQMLEIAPPSGLKLLTSSVNKIYKGLKTIYPDSDE